MEKFKVLKLSKEDLEEVIPAFTELKEVLQKQVKRNNTNKSQGKKDAKELGQHFDIAITAMLTCLAFIENNKEEK